jgi:hypothetical protein
MKESNAAFAWVFVMSASSAIFAINSALFIIEFLKNFNCNKYRRFLIATKLFLMKMKNLKTAASRCPRAF